MLLSLRTVWRWCCCFCCCPRRSRCCACVRRLNQRAGKIKVPELREALGSFKPTSNGADGNLVPMFTASLRDTFNAADRSTDAIPPAMFVQVCDSSCIPVHNCACVVVGGFCPPLFLGISGLCHAASETFNLPAECPNSLGSGWIQFKTRRAWCLDVLLDKKVGLVVRR